MKVTIILQSHPDYLKWTNSYESGNIDLPTFIFMRASTWPDEIRRGGGTDSKYDHPRWHYVDWPLHPPDFPLGEESASNDNALYGISQCEKALSDALVKPEVKAVFLSYLIHLVGDLHQPLHCVSFFGDGYSNGDKGGNDFYVKPGERGIRLHSLWDGLLGTRINPQTQYNEALRISSQFPRASLPELAKDTTPQILEFGRPTTGD